MKHFTLEDWADFARRVTALEHQAAMQLHLDSGCKNCHKVLRMWNSVFDIARQEASYQPPENAVRSVKGYYAILRPREGSRRVGEVARLIFDSFRQPTPAGLRASPASARQLLYRAGNLLVDLRVEPEAKPNQFSLVGQVLNSSKPDQGINDLPVVLLSGSQLVAQALTNQFGEFHLEFGAGKNLRLTIGGRRQGLLVIPLRGIEPEYKRSSRRRDVV